MKREDFLKNEIKKQGYTLKDFAHNINMPYSTLLSIVNSSVGGAALDNIRKICNGLNIDIELLNPNRSSAEKQQTDYGINLTAFEQELIQSIRDLNTLGQKQANDYIKLLLLDDKYLKLPQNIPETEYEMAAYGGKDTKGTISKTKEETTAN